MQKIAKLNSDVIRQRLFIARKLNKMNQSTASRAMGYHNTAMLSKMESISSTTKINLEFLIKAASVYGVSLDYLVGASDYPDREPQTVEHMAYFTSIKAFMEKEIEKFTLAILENVPKQNSIAYLTALINEAVEAVAQFEKVRKINPQFDEELKGGATLVKAIKKLSSTIKKSEFFINKSPYDHTVINDVAAVLSELEFNQMEFNYDCTDRKNTRKKYQQENKAS
ncbi:helix-turn-helix domain-containing protein [Gallibacterium sp. ZY190522]